MTCKRTFARTKAVFSPPTPQDAAELAASMRPADRIEAALMNAMNPLDAVRMSVACSDVAFAARVEGRLMGIFGALRGSLLDADATIWLLCTEEPARHPRDFIANCREGFRLLAAALPDVELFTNFVHAANGSAVKWLEWSGAWFETSTELRGQLGGAFKRFSIIPADAGKED